MTLTEDGKVGVGTTNPQRTFHVHGDILISGHEGSIYFGNEDQEQYLDNGEWAIEFAPAYQGNQSGLNFWKPQGSHYLNGDEYDYGDIDVMNYKLFINDDGNVGIGTGTPGYKLDVCGTIRSTECIIDIPWWGDYVLDKDYKRMTWEEKQNFYLINKHLPGIASGKEIEANGLKAGKTMQGMILNIEENRLDITDLYKMIIGQNKEIETLKKELYELKNKK